jgi:hypothetical protein
MPRRLAKLAKKASAQATVMFAAGEKEMEILRSLIEEGYTMVKYADCTDAVKASMPDARLYDLTTKRQKWRLALAIYEKKEVGMTYRYVIAGTALYGEKKEMEEYTKNTNKVESMYKIYAHMGLNHYIIDITGKSVPYDPEKAAVAKFEIETEA